ncbi:integrase, catalytic region, zinc finger, CCHC-type containing protein, partial [Tanacetum coccineum]
VIQIVLWYLDSGRFKHMTEQHSQLINFVSKFMGTIRFGNDHVVAFMGYGDYQIGNVMISWVYYVEGLGHNLFLVGQFCNSDLKVAFRKHTYYVRDLDNVDLLKGSRGLNLYIMLSHLNFGAINDLAKQGLVRGLPKLKYQKDHLCSVRSLEKSKKQTHKPKSDDSIQEKLYLLHMDLCCPMRIENNGTEFVNQTLKAYYEDVGISHQTSVACTPQQNGIVERQNQTLVEAARTIEDLGKLKPKADIGIFVGYAPAKKAYQIYNRQTCLIMETIHVEFDKLIAMAYEQFGSGPELQLMAPGIIGLGLVQNPSSPTPYVPPIKNDWDILFQPITPLSTSIEQDAPTASSSSTIQEIQSLVISEGVEEQLQPAQFDNDPFLDILTFESSSQESSSIMQPANPLFKHISKWTKIHPLENMIGTLLDLSLHENSYNPMPCGVSVMLSSLQLNIRT